MDVIRVSDPHSEIKHEAIANWERVMHNPTSVYLTSFGTFAFVIHYLTMISPSTSSGLNSNLSKHSRYLVTLFLFKYFSIPARL